SVGGADQAVVLHHVDEVGGAAVADSEAALEERGGGLASFEDHADGVVMEGDRCFPGLEGETWETTNDKADLAAPASRATVVEVKCPCAGAREGAADCVAGSYVPVREGFPDARVGRGDIEEIPLIGGFAPAGRWLSAAACRRPHGRPHGLRSILGVSRVM